MAETYFENALLNAPVDPVVPAIIASTQETVEKFLNQNQTWANSAIETANNCIAALSTMKVPEDYADPPGVTSAVANFYDPTGVHFDDPPDLGSLTVTQPDAFTPTPVTIEDVSGEIPDYVPVVTSLHIPDAPTFALPAGKPTAPDITLVYTAPTAPVAGYGLPPTLDALNLPTYVAPVLPAFTDVPPTFDEIAPSPIISWVEPDYTVELDVKSVLESMLAGGTGLPPAVETAIWERGRDRETRQANATLNANMVAWSSRGFAFPPGRLNGIQIALRDETQRKLNEISREVMIKQADLEQTNRNFAVTAGINYEQMFVNLFLAVVNRNFEIQKFQVETQIQVYNLKITTFNVQNEVFKAQVDLYKVRLEEKFADIKVFEALVGAEKAKAEINTAKVQAYEAQIKAYTADIEAYNSLIKAQIAKAEFEKTRADIYKSEIDAYVAEINGMKVEFDAYDSRVKGEVAKSSLEESNARAYQARVQGIGEKANIIVKQAEATIAAQRLDLEWAVAKLNRLLNISNQELNVIQANLAKFQSINQKAVAKFDAESRGKALEFSANVEAARVNVARFSALMEQWKARAQLIISTAEVQAASLRAAGQIASNLAAGSMAGTHVSAGMTASASAGQSSSRGVSDSTNHSETHAFQHEFVPAGQ